MGELKKTFKKFLAKKGLKSTQQRDLILEAFLASPSHLSTEELYLKIRKKHPSIGYATVYRTLKLFAESGIAVERNFGDKQTRYEVLSAEEHHDHLVCTVCAAIIEFEDPEIERLQENVAGRHGFKVLNHSLELYGICASCSEK